MANSLAIEFKQESFGVEIDGTLYFFRADAAIPRHIRLFEKEVGG